MELSLPGKAFDSGPGISSVGFEHANSAFLCVGPQGEDYLTYAGSTELTTFWLVGPRPHRRGPEQ